MLRKVYSECDHVFVPSEKAKKILVDELGISASKVSVIYNGFDENLFKPIDKMVARQMLSLPQHKKILLNVAALVPVKGHKYLLKAMSIVSRARDDVVLVIIGDGALRKELERDVDALGLKDKVIIAGPKPHKEIPLWMNAADVFVLSSISEGNPTVMFEALSVGLPFVGTSVGGIPEIIKHGEYGLLAKPRDAEDLASKIIEALDTKWDRTKIIEYAKQFSWSNIARKVLNVYNNLIEHNQT